MNFNQIPEIIFSGALFINALLFIPQFVKIIQEKAAHEVSLLTFIGFLLIQAAIVWHGFLNQDWLLVGGYLASMLTCGAVIISVLIYRRHQPLSLQDQLELQDTILALMPGHLYWVGRDGRYLGCNNQQAQSAGLHARGDIIGKRNADLPWNCNAGQLPENLDQINFDVIRTGQKRVIEEPAILQDGSTAVFLSHKVPLHNHRGRIIGMAGISMDITERKQAETALKTAKEAIENAQKTKQAFLENISHDLRTPFCGLLTLTQLLEQEEDDPKKKNYLQLIAESAQALLNHINDILSYVQGAASTPVLNKAFKLPQVLHEVCAIIKPETQLKELEFSCDIDPNLPEIVRGDHLRLQRILMHLLSNAVKFTSSGYVRLEAQLRADQEKHWLIQFIVADSGIGIPEDKRDIIYESFHRLTPTHSALFPGKGLGLTLVKQFLDELGGEANITGGMGQGTNFELLIPFKKPLSLNLNANRSLLRQAQGRP